MKKDDLSILLKNNYSRKQIVSFLDENGISISIVTLNKYLNTKLPNEVTFNKYLPKIGGSIIDINKIKNLRERKKFCVSYQK